MPTCLKFGAWEDKLNFKHHINNLYISVAKNDKSELTTNLPEHKRVY